MSIECLKAHSCCSSCLSRSRSLCAYVCSDVWPSSFVNSVQPRLSYPIIKTITRLSFSPVPLASTGHRHSSACLAARRLNRPADRLVGSAGSLGRARVANQAGKRRPIERVKPARPFRLGVFARATAVPLEFPGMRRDVAGRLNHQARQVT